MSTTPYAAYEPRVIRADSARNSDIACPQSFSSSSVSPTRTRRPSASGVRAPSTQRSSVVHPAIVEPVPFPRPAYLEHSALRHLLQTETIPLLPTRKTEPIIVREEHSSGVRRSQRSPSFDSDEDDMSPPREARKSTPPPTSSSSPALLLPTRWCDQFRHSHLSVCGDGRELIYQGAPGGSEKDTATARTAVPVPPACGIFYYEVEITGKASKSRVSIGFMAPEVKLSRLPGWEKNSWGYHGDSGTICSGDKNGTPFGSTFGVGDIIGCGIDFSQHKVFYTKNGALLGTVFDNVGKDCDIFPAIGLCYTSESIHVNFGQEPFKYDIEDHVLQQRNLTWAKIQSTPLKWPSFSPSSDKDKNDEDTSGTTDERVKMPINELVLSYLSHHGYARTARAFEAQCRVRGGLPAPPLHPAPPVTAAVPPASTAADDHVMDMDIGDIPSPSPLKPSTSTSFRSSASFATDDIELRTHIVQSVISGDIDTALSSTRTHFPLVLVADAGLMLFKLRCRKFVELVLEAAELKKRMGREEGGGNEGAGLAEEDESKGTVDGMGMDIDDEDEDASPSTLNASHTFTNGYSATSGTPSIPIKPTRTPSFPSPSWTETTASQYGSALERAVAYGQELESDYKNRSEVRAIFKRTSVIMAYEDPLEAGGDAAEVAGQQARVALATELNQAILQSQGRPAHPLLDRLYRQTAACLTELALMGNGAAAFADMPKEFLDA
ncbi:hypothetical protein HYDPIDRAFT_179848 [Hydnomerulius pinastri MD-312]|nr:hypothetical protein HYDPIDRAFT_179848 [Hydnomerulius pinastri MD-312]